MAWARIDDAFDDHEKVLALLDLDGGVAAVGLWTLCLAYAHRNTRKKGKIPGLIPATLPRRFAGTDGKAWAGLLVEVGLWDETEDGWMIHDFAEYLPDKEVSAARSAAGKKGAASRWANKQTDGKLPSPDGKSDGKPVATDDTDVASEAEGASAEVIDFEDKQTHGNLPSTHGNLPSASHSRDGKSVANDGSRAGARWDRVDVRTTVLFPEPSPEPVPPSAGTAKPRRAQQVDRELNAGDVVAAWIEAVTDSSGERPANRLIAQIGRQARELLDEGKDAERLIQAASDAGRKGFADLSRELLRSGTAPARDSPAPSRNSKIISAARQRAVAAERQQANAAPLTKGEIIA